MTIIPTEGKNPRVHSNFFAVTTSDTVNFKNEASLYIGVTGNVVAVGRDDVAVTFIGVPAGTILNINAIRVNATSTTATNIVGLY